jgi:hypothetical protein
MNGKRKSSRKSIKRKKTETNELGGRHECGRAMMNKWQSIKQITET